MLTKEHRLIHGVFISLIPFVIMTGFFISEHWTWGLMDDPGFLNQSGPWLERFLNSFRAIFQFGEFRPTSTAYLTSFYPLFNEHPKLFYFFRMILSAVTLVIWGVNAFLLTGRKVVIAFVPVIALSFYFFYDAFAYLSASEPLGLFFSGLMTFCFLKGAMFPVSEQKTLCWGKVCLGIVFLFFAVTSKEPFLSIALALGISLFAFAIRHKRKDLCFLSGLMILAVIGFACYLKFFFSHGYTSAYRITDFPKIFSNLLIWFKHSFIFHLPWLLLSLWAGISHWRHRQKNFFQHPLQVWGMVMAVLMYGGYFLLALPWQVTDFYAIPFGVFFAFGAAILLADFLEECSKNIFYVIVIFALSFSVLVCGQSFGKMTAYRNDTAYLIDWLSYNRLFQYDMRLGFRGATNAMEAGDKLPILIEMESGLKMRAFEHKFMVKDIIQNREIGYYLYNPLLGDQDLRLLNQSWDVVFSSRSWTLFRRLNMVK